MKKNKGEYILRVAGRYAGWFLMACSTYDADGETAMSAQTTRHRNRAMRFEKKYRAERMRDHLNDTYGCKTIVEKISTRQEG